MVVTMYRKSVSAIFLNVFSSSMLLNRVICYTFLLSTYAKVPYATLLNEIKKIVLNILAVLDYRVKYYNYTL